MTQPYCLERLLYVCGPETSRELIKITGWHATRLWSVLQHCIRKGTIHKNGHKYYAKGE